MQSRIVVLLALACTAPVLAQEQRAPVAPRAPNAVAQTFLHFGQPYYSQLAGYMRELGLTPPSALPARR